jgi:hypothetical protein
MELSLARSAAESRGRSRIAATLEAEVAQLLEDHRATMGSDGRSTSEFGTADTTEQIVKRMRVSGSAKRAEWISRSGTVYALMVLDPIATQRARTQMDAATMEALRERIDKSHSRMRDRTEEEP